MDEKDYLNSKQVKQELINMMAEFDKWIRKENIEYSIIAGTLLGAVRHGGMIPWDDDIDICMDRHSYNQLVSILKENKCRMTDYLFATGFELDNSDNPYLKIHTKRVKCTEQVFPGNNSFVFETNLWIDVFPIDGIPNVFPRLYEGLRKSFQNFFYKRRAIYYNWDELDMPKQSTLRRIIFYLKRNIKKCVSYKLTVKVLIWISMLFDYKKCTVVCNNVWGVGIKESFPRKLMNNYIDYDFDGIKVKGMEGGKEWLRIRYGDYMQLPPEDQRETHGIKAWYDYD